MAKRIPPPTFLSLKVFCHHDQVEIEVPADELYFSADCDPCGRYEDGVKVTFDCKCRKRQHTVILKE